MKDEEMAEKYAGNTSGLDISTTLMVAENKTDAYRLGRYDGFLAGLKAGRPQWHDLRKAPDDLPNKELEEKQLVVRVRNYEEDYIFAYYMLDKYYSKNGKRFYSDISCDYPIYIKDIIAWCEIPTFDKE